MNSVIKAKEDKSLTTGTLMRRLFRTSSFEKFKEKNSDAFGLPAFHEYITELCMEKGEVREHVIKRSGLDRVYGHQIFTGRYVPSRDKVIQLAFGFSLDVKGAQELLRIARKPELYPKVERDAAILFSLSHHMEFDEVQELLIELRLPLLGGDRNDK